MTRATRWVSRERAAPGSSDKSLVDADGIAAKQRPDRTAVKWGIAIAAATMLALMGGTTAQNPSDQGSLYLVIALLIPLTSVAIITAMSLFRRQSIWIVLGKLLAMWALLGAVGVLTFLGSLMRGPWGSP